jgi:signal transduction histidine kinase
MDTVIRLSAHMNRYSENIAELLLLGRTELDDFYAARTSLEEKLDLLTELIEQEIGFVWTAEEQREEMEELERVERMRELYEDIDLTAQRLMLLRDQGRQEEAVALFRDDIENRLDEELEEHISAAIADEEAELEFIEARTNRLEDQLILLVLGVCLAAILVSAAAGGWLVRTLTRPIEALISGTRAIGEGNLGYRIRYDHRDEFSDLADQFNTTAARLESQRAHLLDVQAGLENDVARRTSQLEDANGRLQKLDRMRMLFLADLGHELRTPLTVVRGEAEVALRGERPVDEHRDTLKRIVALTQQMGRLVEDLLFLSRAEVGAVRFEMQPISLQDVLDVALSEARVLATDHQLLLHASIPATPCSIEGDAGRLTQALLIVLDNAVNYSDSGSSIEVALACDAPDAEIRVTNTGPEIPAVDLPFVFNRFYRGRQAVAAGTSGSGLGLSIAKWIIETHGGTVALTSARHETTVVIRLPVRT